MDNVSGQPNSLYTRAICNQNMRGFVTSQVGVLITQLSFVNHYALFGVRHGNAERSRLVK